MYSRLSEFILRYMCPTFKILVEVVNNLTQIPEILSLEAMDRGSETQL